jgi:hypothetical protein
MIAIMMIMMMMMMMMRATRMVTLPTKSLLFEFLVPERVGHSVGTGSTSSTNNPHVDKAEIDDGIFLCFNSRGIL